MLPVLFNQQSSIQRYSAIIHGKEKLFTFEKLELTSICLFLPLKNFPQLHRAQADVFILILWSIAQRCSVYCHSRLKHIQIFTLRGCEGVLLCCIFVFKKTQTSNQLLIDFLAISKVTVATHFQYWYITIWQMDANLYRIIKLMFNPKNCCTGLSHKKQKKNMNFIQKAGLKSPNADNNYP